MLIALTPAMSPLRGFAQQSAESAPQCRPAGPLARLSELPEASGLAVGRRVPWRLWAHSDSGEPVLFAVDTKGTVTGRLRLLEAELDDWEAVGVGPCPAGSCIYVADIGDNNANRKRITVYRVTEPADRIEPTARSEAFHATYPDGPHDAEALLVTPEGRLYVVTKGDTGTVAIYRFPNDLQAGVSLQLERVGKPRESGKPRGEDGRITDGAASPDGGWIVLRTNRALTFHRSAELFAGNWREAGRVDLTQLEEPQGEGVAFGADNTIYLAGEGGGKSQPGTFGRLTCTFDLRR